ncbi:O-acetyl-ADP-ribose deacetylase [Aurantimonas sp. VKM B-3413]|uniref:O-acetyl-ADP-ribose deacetylase n=1 Tax=Aurantimonas sp. VKM B-3413 TaxID=2779401 RepID=UPI001E3F819D|nr:O-acetyl-ADP-ribose deacetylase [Aurantimonas sp. VKM B-3413]MCB8838433.1 O-acetyl-ADP-ribose deacetylase [Aurantimonas sp. VKM B-3413]
MTRVARGETILEVLTADITKLTLDAIVNAANQGLKGGGGVDGAIHRAAGKARLQDACRQIGSCPTGEARITPGFGLPARFVIHAVGPRWKDGSKGEDGLLAGAYRHSFRLAVEHEVRTIAFPAISTGVYGFPKERAAAIAARESLAAAEGEAFARIVLCCFSDGDALVYGKALEQEAGS